MSATLFDLCLVLSACVAIVSVASLTLSTTVRSCYVASRPRCTGSSQMARLLSGALPDLDGLIAWVTQRRAVTFWSRDLPCEAQRLKRTRNGVVDSGQDFSGACSSHLALSLFWGRKRKRRRERRKGERDDAGGLPLLPPLDRKKNRAVPFPRVPVCPSSAREHHS